MAEHSHEHQHHTSGQMGKHGRPYAKFWVNMVLGLVVMYFVMFSMIDGARDFRNNLNMLYMAVTMWAPMGIFMLATMPGMFPNRRLNLVLYGLFAVLTLGSLPLPVLKPESAIDSSSRLWSRTIRERSSCAARRSSQIRNSSTYAKRFPMASARRSSR